MDNLNQTGLPEPLPENKHLNEPLRQHLDPECRIYDRVEVYLYHLNEMVLQKERTHATYQTYENALKRFFEWGKERGFPPVDANLILRYKEYLISENLLPATVNVYLVSYIPSLTVH